MRKYFLTKLIGITIRALSAINCMINKGPAKINILTENLAKASLTSFIVHILDIFQVARKCNNDPELLGCRADTLYWIG